MMPPGSPGFFLAGSDHSDGSRFRPFVLAHRPYGRDQKKEAALTQAGKGNPVL